MPIAIVYQTVLLRSTIRVSLHVYRTYEYEYQGLHVVGGGIPVTRWNMQMVSTLSERVGTYSNAAAPRGSFIPVAS